MATTNKRAGKKMRELRESKGLNMREVHALSKRITKSLRNQDYAVGPSRLSDIEHLGHTPNLYRLHSLSLIYDCSFGELLEFYEID